VAARKLPLAAKQAAEKVRFGIEGRQKHAPGAKAHLDSASVIAGTKVPAYLKASFSAACEAAL
jgi:hypothetical protein